MQRLFFSLLLALSIAVGACAQESLTWNQVKRIFEETNPTLHAGQLNIAESKAEEISAYLRPNPNFNMVADQFQPLPATPYRPLANVFPLISFDYLHERQRKRELRLESQQKATAISISQQADLERNLLFNLRSAFVGTLQAKAQLALAKQDLDYFDREYAISQERYRAGDIAQMDLMRIHLQRVQYEQDYETAQVNLRTAKITLLMLLNRRTPVDQFDVTGRFDFNDETMPLERLREAALASRPDLRAALEAVDKAETDHKLAVANGSTDPTFSLDIGRNPPLTFYFGVGVSIPLRIFDRNQGEKLRTEIDIRHAQRQKEAAEAQVFNDVDSAYFTLASAVKLLEPYKSTYLRESADVRDKVSYAFQRGGAALVDFLDAQREYRQTQEAYLTLVGSYMMAAAQVNLAVGEEIIP
jgi:cobalt-zinc-cadmium efflux system outer membrane protein